MCSDIPEGCAGVPDRDAQLVAAQGLIPGVVCPLARSHPFPVLPWCIPLLKQHLQPLAPAGASISPTHFCMLMDIA